MAQDKVKLVFNRLDYLKNSSDRIAIRSLVVKQFLGNVENSRILDIGCGDGSLSLPMLNESNHLTMVDISENMIAKVKEQVPPRLAKNVTLINDSFEKVSDDDRYDIILCVGVIAHVRVVDHLFKKIATLLKPGGLLVIETTPNPYPIGKLLFPYYFIRGLLAGAAPQYSKNRLKVTSLISLTKSMGLERLRSVRYSFPLPGMSHWPHALKLRYTLFTLNNSVVSRFGSEHIFLLKKSNII